MFDITTTTTNNTNTSPVPPLSHVSSHEWKVEVEDEDEDILKRITSFGSIVVDICWDGYSKIPSDPLHMQKME
eukprot:gene12875-27151_t